jgi:hypothetical protein
MVLALGCSRKSLERARITRQLYNTGDALSSSGCLAFTFSRREMCRRAWHVASSLSPARCSRACTRHTTHPPCDMKSLELHVHVVFISSSLAVSLAHKLEQRSTEYNGT